MREEAFEEGSAAGGGGEVERSVAEGVDGGEEVAGGEEEVGDLEVALGGGSVKRRGHEEGVEVGKGLAVGLGGRESGVVEVGGAGC